MKMVIDVETKELLRKLAKVPMDMQDKVIKRSIRAGARTIQKEAKTNAPVDSGTMKSKIRVRQAKKKYSGGFMMLVHVNSPAHHLIELGTKDREPTESKFLVFEGSGGNLIRAKKVKGVKANPFLGRAFDDKKEEVVNKFKATLKRYIDKQ